ncbi:hypothetical protein ACFL0H_14010 [Thermodesulfobacteriota bacterium]
MILSFHPCFVADHQIILGHRSISSEDFSLIKQADAIILPQSCSHELFLACKAPSKQLFPNYETRFKYPGKVGQSLLFKKVCCSHPETLKWNSVEDFRKACRDFFPHDMPFLMKADEVHEADGVYFIEDIETMESSLVRLHNMERSGSMGFISQELIPTDGDVLRVVIIGRRTIAYWKRPEKPGQIITSISKGARIDRHWRNDLREKGETQALNLSAVAGINLAAMDFIFTLAEPDPRPLIIDINYYFGRRGLGGSLNYYALLFEAIKGWLLENGFDPESISPV